ncbi:hypothetical protein DIZ27_08800 [Streptomyces sp. NWU339]|uniref:hypothetical protein n=1 Tax=Streptomyces sp. NWU339 TaxID=2185284 RepID=UPI000D67ABF0|nr:hypothetical protein [Streptomyces sp. NWU339]PWI10948.1 hypothetical protein DIZ27_08800 [Streptomyces sp. NWU339]
MTWSALLPGAALRAMRTAAGRRALHLAFLVGAVLVLGVLCGERAQAADGGGPVSTPFASPVAGAVVSVSGSVGERVVTPVADRLGGVAADLTEVPAKVLPVPSPPSRPQAPALPTLPGLTRPAPLPEPPGLPEVPVEPRLPRLPAVPPDAPNVQGAPDTPGTLPAPFTQSEAPAPPATDASGPTTRPEVPETATHGPDAGGTGTGLAVDPLPYDDTEHRATPPAPPTDPAPTPHAPGGSPDGTTGHRSAADHTTPRHGDAHAVTPGHRLRVRLVPGATASTEAAELRDRYRDVPVSPA